MIHLGNRIKSLGLYTLFSYIGQALNIVVQILIRRVLDPGQMGTYSFVKLLYNYLDLEHGGMRFAIDRELPLSSVGRQREIESAAFSLFIVLAALTAIVSFLVVLSLYSDSPEIWLAFLILNVAALWTSYANFRKAVFRAKEITNAMIFYSLIQPILYGAFAIACLLLFGYWGLISSYLLSSVLICSIFCTKYKLELVIARPALNTVKTLFKVGLPMLANTALSLLSNTIDRWLVLAFFGIEQLGIYSTAGMFMSFAMILPNTISEVFFPRILRLTQKEHAEFSAYFNRIIAILVGINLLASVAASLVIPAVIRFLLPMYLDATDASVVLILVTAPNMLISICSYSLVGFMKQHIIIVTSTAGIAFSISLSFALRFIGMTGMAFAILASRIIVAIFLYYTVMQVSSRRTQ